MHECDKKGKITGKRERHLFSLPQDVLNIAIPALLEVRDLGALACVNKRWNAITLQAYRKIFIRDYPYHK